MDPVLDKFKICQYWLDRQALEEAEGSEQSKGAEMDIPAHAEYKEELPAPEVSLEMVEDSQVTDTPLSQIHAHSKREEKNIPVVSVFYFADFDR